MRDNQARTTIDRPAPEGKHFLDAQELLAGSSLIHEVPIPVEVLSPGAEADAPGVKEGTVKIRPLRLSSLALISQASKENPSLIPLLMIQEALTEPVLHLNQIRQMHAGLAHFLVEQINRISGLASGDDARDAAASTLGQAHLLLARHFGWSPEQVAELTPGQVAVYLAGIERLLALDSAGEGAA